MKLKIFNWKTFKKYTSGNDFSKVQLENILKKIFSVYNISEVSIIFVTDGYIKRLNSEFRNIDSVTDVLSFNLDEKPVTGEVYVCPQFVLKNIGSDFFNEEILRNIVHGVLHILGYDHKDKFGANQKDLEEMFVKQENILQNVLYEINNRSGKSRKKIQ